MSEVDEIWSDKSKQKLVDYLTTTGVPEHALAECGSRILSEISRWIGNKNVHCPTHEYVIAFKRLSPEDGGGYYACIPQLGKGTFNGCGDTPEEALNDLQELYVWLKEEFEKDDSFVFPEPMDFDNIQFVEVERMSAAEVNEKFRGYLLEAHKKNVGDKS